MERVLDCSNGETMMAQKHSMSSMEMVLQKRAVLYVDFPDSLPLDRKLSSRLMNCFLHPMICIGKWQVIGVFLKKKNSQKIISTQMILRCVKWNTLLWNNNLLNGIFLVSSCFFR